MCGKRWKKKINNRKSKKNIQIYFFDIEDNVTFNLHKHFDTIAKLIDERMEQHPGAVLVNCICGISRSATVVIAYLIKQCNLTLQTSMKEVYHVRPHICPNASFIRQLIQYEYDVFGKNSMSYEDCRKILFMD